MHGSPATVKQAHLRTSQVTRPSQRATAAFGTSTVNRVKRLFGLIFHWATPWRVFTPHWVLHWRLFNDTSPVRAKSWMSRFMSQSLIYSKGSSQSSMVRVSFANPREAPSPGLFLPTPISAVIKNTSLSAATATVFLSAS